jgi:hypothetical protein
MRASGRRLTVSFSSALAAAVALRELRLDVGRAWRCRQGRHPTKALIQLSLTFDLTGDGVVLS